jgi:hypothetical protein
MATDDSMIMEGLKTAIVEAFFKQQQYYSQQSGGMVSYGGSATELVKQILDRKEFKAMLTEIVNDFAAHKEPLEALIHASVIQRAKDDTIKYLNNSSNSWELRELIWGTVQDISAKLVKEAVKDDPKIRKAVEDKVGKGDWDIKITVLATVTEKGAS